MASIPFPSASCLRADRGPITAVSHFANTPARFERAQCKSRILHETVLIYFPPSAFLSRVFKYPLTPPFPGILPFQHPVKGTWKRSVDGCHGPPGCLPRAARKQQRARARLPPSSRYLPRSRCGAEPADNGPIPGDELRENFIHKRAHTACHSSSSEASRSRRAVLSLRVLSSLCVCASQKPKVRIRRRFVRPGNLFAVQQVSTCRLQNAPVSLIRKVRRDLCL